MTALRRLTTKLLPWTGLGLLAWTAPAAGAGERGGEEALIKAAYVYNFAKFTRWPEHALGEAGMPLTLCVAGEDAAAEAMTGLAGKPVRGRPLAIVPVKGTAIPKGCHLLYIAASERRQGDLVRSVRGQPILTISEWPDFARAGGIVELFQDKGRIRFAINLGVARGAGLEISPNLLSLAVVVVGVD
jgi:hypothetical protein